jgi:hypothetical protein
MLPADVINEQNGLFIYTASFNLGDIFFFSEQLKRVFLMFANFKNVFGGN